MLAFGRYRSTLLLPALMFTGLLGMFVGGGHRALQAQETEGVTPPRSGAPTSAAERLALEQEQIATRFKRFEEVLLRMAELTAPNDPKRAALLRKAVAESKEQLIGLQLERLAGVLKEDRLAVAVTNQAEVEQDLAKLMELLLTEQRSDRLKDEKERLKEQIRRLKEIINKQTQIQGQTSGDNDPKELSQSQGKLAGDTGQLADEMKRAADAKAAENAPSKEGQPKAGEPKEGDAKPAEGKPSGDERGKQPDGKPGDEKKNADDKNGDDKPSGDKKKPSDDKPGENGKPSEGKPKDGKPSEGKPSDGKPQDGKPNDAKPSEGKPSKGQPMPGQEGEPNDGQSDSSPQPPADQQSPSHKRVAAAREKMEQAKKKLEESKRDGAIKDQEDALRELEQAKAELEEILRQLREEEMERILTQLEARFRQMLEMQREVYEGTLRLDRVPAADRGRNDEIESGRLSRREAQIVIEAEKALAVLREEGSSAAMPEAIDQMSQDMEQVVTWLSQFRVDKQTQGVEEDIIASLEELIAAVQKAQKDLEEKKSQPGQPGQPQEPPLVDKIAELKVIRGMQLKINVRTKRYTELVKGELGQGQDADLLEQLRLLGEREEKIYRAARDIAQGRTQP